MLALKELEGNMAVISVIVLVFRIIVSKRYSLMMNRLIFMASMLTLVYTVITITVLDQTAVEGRESTSSSGSTSLPSLTSSL